MISAELKLLKDDDLIALRHSIADDYLAGGLKSSILYYSLVDLDAELRARPAAHNIWVWENAYRNAARNGETS